MKKIIVKIDHAALDDLVVEHMKESYRQIISDIDALRGRDLKPFQQKDLKNYLKVSKALRRVLRYHMIYEDFMSFMEEF